MRPARLATVAPSDPLDRRVAAKHDRGDREYGAAMSAPERVEYDEFGLFHENAEEYDTQWRGPPNVRRAERAYMGHRGARPRASARGDRPSRPRALGLA